MKNIVLITGSTRGIGRACAIVFARSGYTVILNGRKETKETKKLLKDIQEYSPNSGIFYFDVSNPTQVKRMCQKIIGKYGKIDVLINNAGIVRDRTFLKMSYEEWSEVMQTNLYGVFNTTKEILPVMVQNGFGRVINVSSVMGITGNFGQTNYSASKSALLGFTKSLAKEVASRNITVNAVCPGFVDTDMTRNIPKEYLDKFIDKIPIKRLGDAEEVGKLLVFLASKKSSYITGSIIDINGGLL